MFRDLLLALLAVTLDYSDAVAKEAGIDIEARNVAWDGILNPAARSTNA